MPKVVKADRRQITGGDELVERPGQGVGADRSSPLVGEHISAAVSAEIGKFGVLTDAVTAQRRDGHGIERDHAPAGFGLGPDTR